MKKLILLIAFISLNTIAEEMESIKDFMNKNPKWRTDDPTLVHVGTRCATMMDAVILRYGDDNRPKIISQREHAQKLGDIFTFSTSALAEKINFSSEGYTQKYKLWMDYYKAQALENVQKHNNLFYRDFVEDFEVCNANIDIFVNLLQRIAN